MSCVGRVAAYVGGDDPNGVIHICPLFLRSPPDEQAEDLTHEMSHSVGMKSEEKASEVALATLMLNGIQPYLNAYFEADFFTEYRQMFEGFYQKLFAAHSFEKVKGSIAVELKNDIIKAMLDSAGPDDIFYLSEFNGYPSPTILDCTIQLNKSSEEIRQLVNQNKSLTVEVLGVLLDDRTQNKIYKGWDSDPLVQGAAKTLMTTEFLFKGDLIRNFTCRDHYPVPLTEELMENTFKGNLKFKSTSGTLRIYDNFHEFSKAWELNQKELNKKQRVQ